MAKFSNTTSEDVRASVGSLYAELLNRRQSEREARREQKRMEQELRKQEEEEKHTKEDGTKMTKKERRQAEFDNWKDIVVGLTGDDLEYSSKKKSKKKYRKWIDDEDVNAIITAKAKKPKKKNYNKEFEPELNMLRTLVAEQNRFTADLQRRFMNAAGPSTKDAMPPAKTLVELASVISSGRTNSLGMLREIGNLKKNIADLYMKQKKLDSEISGTGMMDTADIGLMGSNIAASMFGGGSSYASTSQVMEPVGEIIGGAAPVQPDQHFATPVAPTVSTQPMAMQPVMAEAFDPNSWAGPELVNTFTQYENVPHSIIVEKNQATGAMRFVALRDDTGEEIVGANMPTSDPSKLTINEKDMTVKGNFDEVYPLRYV